MTTDNEWEGFVEDDEELDEDGQRPYEFVVYYYASPEVAFSLDEIIKAGAKALNLQDNQFIFIESSMRDSGHF